MYNKIEAEYLMKHISECPLRYFRRHKRREGPEKQYGLQKNLFHSVQKGNKGRAVPRGKDVT